MYDDEDVRWTYSSGWAPSSGMTGPYNGTIYYTTTPNATATFTFQSPAMFSFYYAKASSRGTFQILVDGVVLETIDAYASTKTWQNTYTSPVYSGTATHMVTIKNVSTGAQQVDVDAIKIIGVATPSATPYDDAGGYWNYSSAWLPSTGMTGPYDGTIYYTTTPNSTATFTFQAPARFTFYYAKASSRGTFEIKVDGVVVTTINAYASTKTWQNTYTSANYTDTGTHTVTIKNVSSGSQQVDVDAIIVTAIP